MLPNFIIVGPQKTGSSWLHACLSKHPEICLPKNVKETFFFDKHFDRGWRWYERYFSDCENRTAVGEVAPTYFSHAMVPARIARLCPETKIVVCLRNPVERSWSAYLDAWRKGDTILPFALAIKKEPRFLDDSLYAKHLNRYFSVFKNEKIYVIVYEDIKDNYQMVLCELLKFLEVNDYLQPSIGSDKINVFRKPRSSFLSHTTTKVVRKLHNHGLHRIVNVAKDFGLKNIVYRPASTSDALLSSGIRTELIKYFRNDVRDLSTLLDKNLENRWFNL